MNVNVSNNMAMKSSMVGIPQQTLTPKEIKQDQDRAAFVRDLEQDKDALELQQEQTIVREFKEQPQIKKETAPIQRRQVAETERRSETQESWEAPETTEQGLPARLKYDTVSLITHRFDAWQRAQQMEQSWGQSQHLLAPDVQRKVFINNLRKWVDLEYQQYIKSDTALYTRRNLREILQALGEQETSNIRRTSARKRNLSDTKVEFSNYNRYNVDQASKVLKIFEEVETPRQELQYDLVA